MDENFKVLSTDDDNEYAELRTWSPFKGTGHKSNVPDREVNALRVLDTAVQDIRERFTVILADTGKGEERSKRKKALKAKTKN